MKGLRTQAFHLLYLPLQDPRRGPRIKTGVPSRISRAGVNYGRNMMIIWQGRLFREIYSSSICPVIFGSKSRNSLQRELIQNVRSHDPDIFSNLNIPAD